MLQKNVSQPFPVKGGGCLICVCRTKGFWDKKKSVSTVAKVVVFSETCNIFAEKIEEKYEKNYWNGECPHGCIVSIV